MRLNSLKYILVSYTIFLVSENQCTVVYLSGYITFLVNRNSIVQLIQYNLLYDIITAPCQSLGW